MQCYVKIYSRNKKGRNLNLLGNKRNFDPLVELNGRFCHLSGYVAPRAWTWLNSLYMANDDVKKFVGMMDGLAFLPVQDITAGVVIVRNFMPNPALAPLLTYFLQTYVGVWVLNANNQMVSRPTLFPLLSWNVYTITLNGGSRTNNVCEGWNNSFRLLVGQHHPPLYKCIEPLLRDNVIVRIHMAQSTNGTRHRTPVKRNYVTSQRNLQRACQAYQQVRYANNMQMYLERISHAIRF